MSFKRSVYFLVFISVFIGSSVILGMVLLPIILLMIIPGLVSKLGVLDIESPIQKIVQSLHLSEIRSDLMEMVSNEAVQWDCDGVDAELREIKSEGERRHEHGELIFVATLTLFIISSRRFDLFIQDSMITYFGGWGLEISLLLLALLILVRTNLLEELTYNGVEDVETGDLESAVMWQRMVATVSIALPFILSMGIVRYLFGEDRYLDAMQIVSNRASYDKQANWLREEFSKQV